MRRHGEEALTGSRGEVGRRLRYAFDRAVAAGPIVLIGWLALMAALFAVAAGLLLSFAHIFQRGGKPLGVVEATWESLMRTLDPGTMGGDQGWKFRAVMLAVTLAGLLFVSTLISIVNNGMGQMFERLRKGRSPVVERDHLVVLGWSSSIFAVVSQLNLARPDGALSGRVVVLADVDPVEMHDAVVAKARPAHPLPIFRRGSPTSPEDLRLVAPHQASSIIVLAPDEPDDDSQLIKTMLALHSLRTAEKSGPWPNLAVELRKAAHEKVIRQIVGLAPNPEPDVGFESPTIGVTLSDDLMARIIVQSSRQAGLSSVYDDLLSFQGCEFFTETAPAAYHGLSFRDLVLRTPNASPIGWLRGSRIMLAPPVDHTVERGDRLVVVRQDQTKLGEPVPVQALQVTEALLQPAGERKEPAAQILVLGWNARGPIVLREMPNYVAPGSSVTVAADRAQVDAEVEQLCGRLGRMVVKCRRGDTSDREFLQDLGPQRFDHIIVLGYTGPGVCPQSADTRTLITLLHLRQLLDESGIDTRGITIVSEMLDIRNKALAEVTRADDFVVSDHLISLKLAQTAVNAHIHPILKELLSHEGAELYTRPAGEYLKLPAEGRQSMSYATVLAAGLKRGEAVIGYRKCQDNPVAETVLNPSRLMALELGRADMLVVAAQGSPSSAAARTRRDLGAVEAVNPSAAR